jgi:hypothetical protein
MAKVYKAKRIRQEFGKPGESFIGNWCIRIKARGESNQPDYASEEAERGLGETGNKQNKRFGIRLSV